MISWIFKFLFGLVWVWFCWTDGHTLTFLGSCSWKDKNSKIPLREYFCSCGSGLGCVPESLLQFCSFFPSLSRSSRPGNSSSGGDCVMVGSDQHPPTPQVTDKTWVHSKVTTWRQTAAHLKPWDLLHTQIGIFCGNRSLHALCFCYH